MPPVTTGIAPSPRTICAWAGDKDGNIITPKEAGMPGDWPEKQEVTVTFEEKNGKTVMDLIHTDFPPEMVAECTKGWNESFDKLEASVEKA